MNPDHAGYSWLASDDGADYSETLSAEFARITRAIPATMPDPSEQDQFHAAIYGHAAGTCPTCDTVRESGVFARNGRRPIVAGRFWPTR